MTWADACSFRDSRRGSCTNCSCASDATMPSARRDEAIAHSSAPNANAADPVMLDTVAVPLAPEDLRFSTAMRSPRCDVAARSNARPATTTCFVVSCHATGTRHAVRRRGEFTVRGVWRVTAPEIGCLDDVRESNTPRVVGDAAAARASARSSVCAPPADADDATVLARPRIALLRLPWALDDGEATDALLLARSRSRALTATCLATSSFHAQNTLRDRASPPRARAPTTTTLAPGAAARHAASERKQRETSRICAMQIAAAVRWRSLD